MHPKKSKEIKSKKTLCQNLQVNVYDGSLQVLDK